MVTMSRCRGNEGRTCHCFLPSHDKVSYELCVVCRGQHCSSDVECDHFRSLSSEEWTRVQTYNDKLVAQCKRKKERRAHSDPPLLFFGYSEFFTSFRWFSPHPGRSGYRPYEMSILMLAFSPVPTYFDSHNVVIMTTLSSSCTDVFTTMPITSPCSLLCCQFMIMDTFQTNAGR